MQIQEKPPIEESEESSLAKRGLMIRGILAQRSAKIGIAIIVALALFLVLGTLLTPYAPTSEASTPNLPPNFAHPFGTDSLGHDLLSQITYGAYPSLVISIEASVGSAIFGFFMGVASGYFKRLESVLSLATDVILTFPLLVILMVVLSLFYPTNTNIAITLMIFIWALPARAIRNQVASRKKQAYVSAARLSGVSDLKIAFRIIAPDVAPISIAYFIIQVSATIILVTSLEFLGVANPNLVNWGAIFYWAAQFAFVYGDWWWIVEPGILITLFAFGCALIGFSLEEFINPRLKTKGN